MGEMCMTDEGLTQDNFILPAPPVGLPISQDWLDRVKIYAGLVIKKNQIMFKNYVLQLFTSTVYLLTSPQCVVTNEISLQANMRWDLVREIFGMENEMIMVNKNDYSK